jgi:hypothetical protein
MEGGHLEIGSVGCLARRSEPLRAMTLEDMRHSSSVVTASHSTFRALRTRLRVPTTLRTTWLRNL